MLSSITLIRCCVLYSFFLPGESLTNGISCASWCGKWWKLSRTGYESLRPFHGNKGVVYRKKFHSYQYHQQGIFFRGLVARLKQFYSLLL
jgi:hypothetical protein